METRNSRKAVNYSTSITYALTVLMLVSVLIFGSDVTRWPTNRDLRNEAEYLRRAGVKPSAATDRLYQQVYFCYHYTAGLMGTEPLKLCADDAANVVISTSNQGDRQEQQNLLARIKSDHP